MADKMVHLSLTPDRNLEFPAVLYSSANTDLLLENITNAMVAFKIKTTAPKNYLVRPSTGVIHPGKSQNIQIILQALTEEPNFDTPDRFLVQSTIVESEDVPKELWTTMDKSRLHDQRLCVLFKKPDQHPGGVDVAGDGTSCGGSMPGHQSVVCGKQQANSVSGQSTLNASNNIADVKVKYDELVKYTLAVEKTKNTLEKENEALKGRLQHHKADGRSGSVRMFGFEVWHLPVYILLFLVLWYLLGYSPSNAPANVSKST